MTKEVTTLTTQAWGVASDGLTARKRAILLLSCVAALPFILIWAALHPEPREPTPPGL